MAYFTPGSLIRPSTSSGQAAEPMPPPGASPKGRRSALTQINPDGSIEVVFVSGKRKPPTTVKRIERPEKYERVRRDGPISDSGKPARGNNPTSNA
jgi:hypothetical protein